MTARLHEVWLSAIGYELGAPRPVSELFGRAPTVDAALSRGEFDRYLVSDGGCPFSLASAAADKTLAATEIPPSEIDLVVFATDSFHSVQRTMAFFKEFSAARDLRRAFPMIVTMSECANLHTALDVAWQAIRLGRARNVLLLTVDLADIVSPASRVVSNGIGIMSDAAASCILSSQPGEGLRLRGIEKRISPQLVGGEMSPQEELLTRIEANNAILDGVLSAAGIAPAKVTKILPSNLSVPVLQTFFCEMGFMPEQLFTANHKRIAHCLASDCLINLRDYAIAAGASAGERFLLYGVGPVTWGAALLEADHETWQI